MGKCRKATEKRKINSKRTLSLNKKLEIKYCFQGLLLTIAIAYLFYKSLIGVIVGLVVIPFWYRLCEENDAEKKRTQLLVEFKDFMMFIVSGLQTGYSLEKACLQSEKELIHLYSTNCQLASKVHVMNQKISMNMQVEKAFIEFAKAIEIEEAISLAEVISFAKRSGGDYGKNIKQTAFKIEESMAVKQEIETITTEKRLELKVMSFMPMGILGYISLTSSSFISPLYGNLIGIFLMTICLVVYGLLIMLGRKIVQINV